MTNIYTLIPQILIILALAGIIIIFARKVPKLSQMQAQTQTVENRKPSVINRSTKKVISFSVNIIRTLFAKIVRIKNIKKEQTQKAVKEEEVKELVTERPEMTTVVPNKKAAQPVQQEDTVDLYTKANQFFLANQLKKAEKIYLELAKDNPNDTQAYRGLGKIYLKQKNLRDAQSAYEQVVKLAPNDFKAQAEIQKIRNMRTG